MHLFNTNFLLTYIEKQKYKGNFSDGKNNDKLSIYFLYQFLISVIIAWALFHLVMTACIQPPQSVEKTPIKTREMTTKQRSTKYFIIHRCQWKFVFTQKRAHSGFWWCDNECFCMYMCKAYAFIQKDEGRHVEHKMKKICS